MSVASLEAELPAGDRLLLDSATLIAYLDGRDAVSSLATHVIDTLVQSGRNSALIAMVSVMEVLVRPLRTSHTHYQHTLDFLQNFANLRPVVIDLPVAQEAASLRAQHNFRAPDALIIASGLVHQVGHLVTNDHQWAAKLQPIRARLRVCLLDDHLQP